MSEDNPFGVSDMGDSIVPVFELTWSEDGETWSRTTDEIPEIEQFPDAARALAEFGKEDDECEVQLLRYES